MGIEVQTPWQQSQSVLKSYWELATDGERKLLAVNDDSDDEKESQGGELAYPEGGYGSYLFRILSNCVFTKILSGLRGITI